MRRALCSAVLAAVLFGLTACGDETITMSISVLGQSVSAVVTGSSDAINQAKSQINTAISGLGTVQVSDGDHHQGNKVCETDVSKNNLTYHVVIYSTSPLATPTTCDTIRSG